MIRNIWNQILAVFEDESYKMRWVAEDWCMLLRGCPHPMAYTREI